MTDAAPGMERIERSMRVHGRRTTIVLERTYWDCLDDAARELRTRVPELVAEVCERVPGRAGGLGASYNRALRVWVVRYWRERCPNKQIKHDAQ